MGRKNKIVVVEGTWGNVTAEEVGQYAYRFIETLRRVTKLDGSDELLDLEVIRLKGDDRDELKRVLLDRPDVLVFLSRSWIQYAREVKRNTMHRLMEVYVLTGLVPYDEVTIVPKHLLSSQASMSALARGY